jgi:hypothetical protein
MGFVVTNGNFMTLDPSSTSDKWGQPDRRIWQLHAHIDDRFLVGFIDDTQSDDSW